MTPSSEMFWLRTIVPICFSFSRRVDFSLLAAKTTGTTVTHRCVPRPSIEEAVLCGVRQRPHHHGRRLRLRPGRYRRDDRVHTKCVGHCFYPRDRALQRGRILVESPSTEELDFCHAEAGFGEHDAHSVDVETGRHGPGQVVHMRPDPGETGLRGRSAWNP